MIQNLPPISNEIYDPPAASRPEPVRRADQEFVRAYDDLGDRKGSSDQDALDRSGDPGEGTKTEKSSHSENESANNSDEDAASAETSSEMVQQPSAEETDDTAPAMPGPFNPNGPQEGAEKEALDTVPVPQAPPNTLDTAFGVASEGAVSPGHAQSHAQLGAAAGASTDLSNSSKPAGGTDLASTAVATPTQGEKSEAARAAELAPAQRPENALNSTAAKSVVQTGASLSEMGGTPAANLAKTIAKSAATSDEKIVETTPADGVDEFADSDLLGEDGEVDLTGNRTADPRLSGGVLWQSSAQISVAMRAEQELSNANIPSDRTAESDQEVSEALVRASEPLLTPAAQTPAGSQGIRADAGQVVSQLSAAVQRNGAGQFEVALNPPELGRLRIVLESQDSGMVISISADKSETMDLIRRHVDQLEREFRELGYESLTFNFTSSDGTARDDRHGQDEVLPIGSEPQLDAASPSGPGQGGSALDGQGRMDIRL